MNKRLSNYIGRSAATLPTIMYGYTCPSIGEIQDAIDARRKGDTSFNFAPKVLFNTVNHKRRIKRRLKQILKVNPKLVTFEQKRVAALLLMMSYSKDLQNNIKPVKQIQEDAKGEKPVVIDAPRTEDI